MNVYEYIKQEVMIDGDLYFPVMSQSNYNTMAIEVSKELKKIASEFLILLRDLNRSEFECYEIFFNEIIKSFDNLDRFRENIENCHSLRLGGYGGLSEQIVIEPYENYKEFYNRFQVIFEKWSVVSTNGWLAVRSLIKDTSIE